MGGGRGCAGALTGPSTRHLLPKNFEKTALRKRVGIFTVKMRGGHIYGNDCTTPRGIGIILLLVLLLRVGILLLGGIGYYY